MRRKNNTEEIYFAKVLVVLLAGLLILTFTFIASYNRAKNSSSDIILPGGVTYLGPSQSSK